VDFNEECTRTQGVWQKRTREERNKRRNIKQKEKKNINQQMKNKYKKVGTHLHFHKNIPP